MFKKIVTGGIYTRPPFLFVLVSEKFDRKSSWGKCRERFALISLNSVGITIGVYSRIPVNEIKLGTVDQKRSSVRTFLRVRVVVVQTDDILRPNRVLQTVDGLWKNDVLRKYEVLGTDNIR